MLVKRDGKTSNAAAEAGGMKSPSKPIETVGSPIPEMPFVAPAAKNVAAIPVNNKMSMRQVSAAASLVSRRMIRKPDSAEPKLNLDWLHGHVRSCPKADPWALGLQM
jgi:hypothetical protein